MWRFFLTQKEWQVTNFITDAMFWPKKPVVREYNLLDDHEFFYFFFTSRHARYESDFRKLNFLGFL